MVQHMKRAHIQLHYKQSGSVLVVSLLMLLVLTIIGVTAMQTNILEERMAGNSRDQSLALQAAEAALRQAEQDIEAIVSPVAAFDGTTDWLYPEDSNPDVFADSTWTTAADYSNNEIINVPIPPKYIIELMGTSGAATEDPNIVNFGESSGVGNVYNFRITARGTGRSTDAVSILQTYYAKPF